MDCYDRIKDLCDRNGIAVTALEAQLGFGRGSIGKMRSAKSVSAERVRKIADYFGVSTEYLLTGENADGYYYDAETAAVAQEIYQNPELHMLFDAARDSKPEELKKFAEMILLLKRKENYED